MNPCFCALVVSRGGAIASPGSSKILDTLLPDGDVIWQVESVK